MITDTKIQNTKRLEIFFHAVDPKRTPDFRKWIAALEKEYILLANQMGGWELLDLSDLPEDANLIGAKWVLKLKYKMANTKSIRRVLLHSDISSDKISTSL